MQNSKQDSFVKAQNKNRRFDDGLTKQLNPKKFQKSKRPRQENSGYSH